MFDRIEGLVCWKCGASLDGVPMPLSRLSECLSCRAELHVCRQCEFYDTKVAQACREPLAEEVKDKTRANFCEHFYPRPGAFEAGAPASQGPSAGLAALFGEAPAGDASGTSSGPDETGDQAPPAANPLEDLFRK
jgi:ribosomal protein L40E